MAPLALASADRRTIAVYLPVGGEIQLSSALGRGLSATWFDPSSGETRGALVAVGRLAAPADEWAGHPKDWALIVRSS